MISWKPSKQHLIIFTRYPEPGTTKTRLIPVLGDVGAANLHKQMTEHTIFQVKELQRTTRVSVEVRFTGGNLEKMQNWLGNDLKYQSQGKGDLGARMERSLINAFNQKAERVIIIGTDCPDLNSQILTTAFEELKVCNLVLGPALDGGYVLIGLSQFESSIFQNMMWSTDSVFRETIRRIDLLGWRVTQLETLRDIDESADLAFLPDAFK